MKTAAEFGPFFVEINAGQVNISFEHIGLSETIHTGETPISAASYDWLQSVHNRGDGR